MRDHAETQTYHVRAAGALIICDRNTLLGWVRFCLDNGHVPTVTVAGDEGQNQASSKTTEANANA